MKIIFMGTPEFALPSLEALVASKHEVVAVFTAPPKPQGRGLTVSKSVVHQLADHHDIKVHTPNNLKNPETLDLITSIDAEVIVVVAYGFIIPKIVLESKRYGCLNIHPSDLPKYRGAAPLQRTIINDDTLTAVCIMQMDIGLDTGDIILQQKFNLDPSVTLDSLSKTCAEIGANLLLETLAKIDILPRIPQSNDNLIYANKLTKEEGKIDWYDSARSIDCKIRGMTPWPGVYFTYENKIFKVLAAQHKNLTHNHQAGTVIDDKLLIACGQDSLQLLEIQQAGKKIMSVEDFLRGNPIAIGTILT